ncbi:MAG: ATP phosphoribosyltransferase [Thermoanaerobaculia bacterium]
MSLFRIAVPKGRLQEPSLTLFADAGLPVPSRFDLESRALRFATDGFEWIFVKDADVPVYVEHGAADAGIAGIDQIEEQRASVYQPLELPFGKCRLMLIGPEGSAGPEPARRTTIATKYPLLARERLGARAARAEIVTLQGSVELALVLGLADYIVDLVETGETIRANRLQPLEVLQEIAPRLAVNRETFRFKGPAVRALIENVSRALDARKIAEVTR